MLESFGPIPFHRLLPAGSGLVRIPPLGEASVRSPPYAGPREEKRGRSSGQNHSGRPKKPREFGGMYLDSFAIHFLGSHIFFGGKRVSI